MAEKQSGGIGNENEINRTRQNNKQTKLITEKKDNGKRMTFKIGQDIGKKVEMEKLWKDLGKYIDRELEGNRRICKEYLKELKIKRKWKKRIVNYNMKTCNFYYC